MAKKPPITVVIPPAVPKKKGSAWDQFVSYWAKKVPTFTPSVAANVRAAAREYGIDPIYFASVILLESKGNYNTPDSSTGAIGIGQLEPSTFLGHPSPWNPHHAITMADLRDPSKNLRISASYMAGLIGSGQGYVDAYNRYYNGPRGGPVPSQTIDPHAKGPASVWSAALPTYVPQTTSTAPASPVGTQGPGGTGTPKPDVPFRDYYVVGVDSKGKFVTTRDPNKALQYDGAPLTRSSFLTLRDQLTSHYVSYTGQRPTNKQIETFLYGGMKGKKGPDGKPVTPSSAHAWSFYTLDQMLSHSKNFEKSPLFKQRGIPLQDAVKDLLPAGTKVPKELMRRAIVNSWGADTLAAELRKGQQYVGSNEFKGNVASLLNVHDSIMGRASPQDMIGVRDAALAGWTTDQYAAYLRSQPGYKNSTEYQSRGLTLLDSLGLITGQQTVISPNVQGAPGGNLAPNPTGILPADKRIPGKPTSNGPSALAGLGATLEG